MLLPKTQLQLTGVTALFIASKFFEVEPMNLDVCYENVCFQKYAMEEFMDKEIDILKILDCDIDSPTILDFSLIYFKMLKKRLQDNCIPITRSLKEFLHDVENMTYELTKACLLD